MKILVIRTGAVGDSVLLSPLLQNLRALDHRTIVHVLGHPDRVRLLLGAPNADSVLSSEDPRWLQLHREQRPGDPAAEWLSAYGAVLHYSSRPDGILERSLRRILGTRCIPFPALPWKGYRGHYAEFLLLPLAALRYPGRLVPPVVSWVGQSLEHGPQKPDAPLLVLHPGAGSSAKRAPLELFLSLVRGLPRPSRVRCRFLLGPADMDLERDLRCAGAETVSGLSIAQVVALLRSAKAYAGNDSGITHLAAALGLPTAAFFISSDPAVWRPLGPKVALFDLRRASTSGTLSPEAGAYLAENLL